MTAEAGNTNARRGRAFEYEIRTICKQAGCIVIRGAGSKGAAGEDLLAFHPSGRVFAIQCKLHAWPGPDDRAAMQPWFTVGVVPVCASRPVRNKPIVWRELHPEHGPRALRATRATWTTLEGPPWRDRG